MLVLSAVDVTDFYSLPGHHRLMVNLIVEDNLELTVLLMRLEQCGLVGLYTSVLLACQRLVPVRDDDLAALAELGVVLSWQLPGQPGDLALNKLLWTYPSDDEEVADATT